MVRQRLHHGALPAAELAGEIIPCCKHEHEAARPGVRAGRPGGQEKIQGGEHVRKMAQHEGEVEDVDEPGEWRDEHGELVGGQAAWRGGAWESGEGMDGRTKRVMWTIWETAMGTENMGAAEVGTVRRDEGGGGEVGMEM